MGAASSSLAGSEAYAGKLCGLEDVPENCITAMFMYMEPPEICILARVNRSFHRASRSDTVWEHKLPLNYKFLVRRILEDQQVGEKDKVISRTKEIYARLCQPNLFDAGTKVFILIIYILVFRIFHISDGHIRPVDISWGVGKEKNILYILRD